jgi:hypothetical protein
MPTLTSKIKYYDEIIGITDVLGGSSPVDRNFTKTIDELTVLYFSYADLLDSFQIWMDTLVEMLEAICLN